jgi:site-specific recombinase XerD
MLLTVERIVIERQNYLKIKEHLKYLEEVLQLNPASVERYRFYLRHLLLWADDQHFRNVQSIRPTLPSYLASLPGKDGRGTLASASQKKILDSSKRFFRWAKVTYPREMNNLPVSWFETLRQPRQPQKSSENVFVSLGEIQILVNTSIPEDNLALLRDKAASAMLFLSGMRASAFSTLPISAVDLENLTLRQWPELGVQTKNGKKATTFLLNLPEVLEPVRQWDEIVRKSLPGSSPWYAPISHSWGDQFLSQEQPGKTRSQALQKRLQLLFSLAELDFKSPHKFRHGHAVYGLLHAQTMADYKAVSMNLMHESIEITDSTYAPMLSSDVQERIAGLSGKAMSTPGCQAHLVGDELESFLNKLDHESQKRALIFIAERLAQ